MSTISKDAAVRRFVSLLDEAAHPGLITWRCAFTAALEGVLDIASDGDEIVDLLGMYVHPFQNKAVALRSEAGLIAPKIAGLMSSSAPDAPSVIAAIRAAALALATEA